MKNQALFSSKDNSKKLKCRLLQFLLGALRVNEIESVIAFPISVFLHLKDLSKLYFFCMYDTCKLGIRLQACPHAYLIVLQDRTLYQNWHLSNYISHLSVTLYKKLEQQDHSVFCHKHEHCKALL